MLGGEIVAVLALAVVIVFMVIVAPIWIIAHYVTRWRTARTLTGNDEQLLDDLWRAAERIEGRVETIERILDAESGDWRTSL